MIGSLIPALKGKNYVFVDVETTGASANYGQVIEIGIIRVENGVVTHTYETLIRPSASISNLITQITGITNDDLADKPQFDEVAIQIHELLLDAIFVAHFARFDYGFLKNEFKRLGMTWNAKTLCTVRLSKVLFPNQKSHSLENIIQIHRLEVEARHRAFADAKAMVDFIRKVSNEHDIETAINSAMGTYILPANIDESMVKNLPHSPGVYLFYDVSDNLLYIGKSVDIKNRVKSHFSQSHTSNKERAITSEVAYIDYEETSGELSALLRESALIKELAPAHNRRLRKTATLAFFKSAVNAKGYKTGSIFYQSSMDVWDTKNIEGMFRTVTSGKAVIKKYQEEFQLCPKLLELEKGKGACFQFQLDTCLGACIGKESPEDYNSRHDAAFAKIKIKSWPFSGAIVLPEEPDAEEGSAYVIEGWKIKKVISYTNGSYSETDLDVPFDYDTYRILSKYLLSKNRPQVFPYQLETLRNW